MKFLKEYWQLLVIGILLIIIFFGGFVLGKTLSENKSIKEDKKEYLQFKKQQDSTITVLTKDKQLLLDSVTNMIKEAVNINDSTNTRIVIIKENDERLRKEIYSIPLNTVDSNTKLFNRLADEYTPGK